MAVGRVVFENLKIITDKEMTEEYWKGSMTELRSLKASVEEAKDVVAALERHEEDVPISSGLRNLVALLYDADDLIDEIRIRCNRGKMISRDAETEAEAEAEAEAETEAEVEPEAEAEAKAKAKGKAEPEAKPEAEAEHETEAEAGAEHETEAEAGAEHETEAEAVDGNRHHLGVHTLQKVVKTIQKVGLFFSSSSSKQTVVPPSLARQVQKLGLAIEELGKQLMDKCGTTINETESISDLPQSYTTAINEVIGRKTKKDEIINRLLNTQGINKSGVNITSISGPSGLGKSALANLVYTDAAVKSNFDLRMWIKVSQTSNETEIIQAIVESCTNRRSNYRRNTKTAKVLHSRVPQTEEGIFGNLLGCQSSDAITSYGASKNEIEAKKKEAKKREIDEAEQKETEAYRRRLRKEIQGKLYLLVLDDTCITLGQGLKDLLTAGAEGSQILVTTRVQGADLAQPEILDYKLEGLTDDDSWSLFERFAFGKKNHPRYSELKEIGVAIAKNCGGIPLTIKVAASYLYGKSKESWSGLNQQLMPQVTSEAYKLKHILAVSYRDLPTRLKACFSYCSLFPDDFTFKKHDLIRLWIAQGFINPEPAKNMEENAEKYFLELSRRCFFDELVCDDLRNTVTCKMHHIMRSLACQNSAGIISSCITDSRVSLESTYKHVSFTSDGDSLRDISKTMLQAQNLRTLVSVKEPYSDTKIGSSVFNKFISIFKCLRVLDLHDLGIKELPLFIGKLIHLRYLDLSKNDSLLTLPKSFTKLYNLQTLKLNSCTKLRRLSGNFGELVNLTCFEIDNCDRLTCMPRGLENLTQLQTLSRFVVGQDISKDNLGIKALKDLKDLKGRLAIEFTGDWTTTIPEDPQAELSNKSNLAELKISWAKTVLTCKKKSNTLSEEEKSSYKQLLEKLQPNLDLKILCIEGYRGGDFPNWAGMYMLATLPNLVVISIEGCDECKHLPPFGNLPNLKELTLRHMANVEYVHEERIQRAAPGDNQESDSAFPVFFPCLEKLTLHNFYKLERWWKEEVKLTSELVPSFLHLRKLRIWNCPNLRAMPLFTKVLDLNLWNINQALLEESATKISIETSASSSRSINQIEESPGQIPNDSNSSSISEIEESPGQISNDSNSSSNRNVNQEQLEESAYEIPKRLQIKGCSNLTSFKTVKQGLANFNSLQKLVIEECHALSSLTSELSFLKALETLEISYCKELDLTEDESDNMENNPWSSLTSLRHLTLREIPKMKSLPKGLKYVQTLRSLCISACDSMTALPQWINELTSLQHLRIESCNAITRLPNELKKITSLKKVEITECPELMENCKEHTGKDWPRILLHKSWRYGLMPKIGASQNRSNVRELNNVKYIIIPVIAAADVRI